MLFIYLNFTDDLPLLNPVNKSIGNLANSQRHQLFETEGNEPGEFDSTLLFSRASLLKFETEMTIKCLLSALLYVDLLYLFIFFY